MVTPHPANIHARYARLYSVPGMILDVCLRSDPQWIALSDHKDPVTPAGIADVVQRGSFVMELASPKQGMAVLLDYKSDAGWPRAFSIFQDANAGLIVLHRQADSLMRHHLPGPLPQEWDLARLTYAWDGPARIWSLRLEDCAGTWVHQMQGINPIPMAGADIAALCAGQNVTRKDVSVHWFGVCLQTCTPQPVGWIGKRCPVDTGRGPIAAEDLRPGDLVVTRDNGPQTLHAVHHMTVPNRGRFAPMLLRAPYFARASDLLVSQGQLTLLTGAAVEYLFGEDAVLAPAAALRDGNSALPDTRRQLTACVALDLGAPNLILADGCPLLCGDASGPLPYRLLQDYEALSLTGGGRHLSAA